MASKTILTKKDCKSILQAKLKSCNFEIKSYKLETFAQRKGLLGEHYQLIIDASCNDSGQIHRFFVKTLPQIESQKKFAMESGAFYKEHQFFDKMLPHFASVNIDFLTRIIPLCFLTRLNDVAVFEDVEILGYDTLPQRQSLSYECVVLAIKAMAKLHASGFILEESLSKSSSKYRMIDEYSKEFEESFYSLSETSVNLRKANKNAIKTEIDMFTDKVTAYKLGVDCFKALAVEYIDGYNNWVKPSKTYRNTICHGDLWASNLMFKFENCKAIDLKVIDFQSYRYLPPAHDILCFLYLSTDRSFRKLYKKQVLDLYYSELKYILNSFDIDINSVLNCNEYESSLEEYEKFAVSQSCTHFTSIMLTKEQLTQLFADPEYNHKIFFEDRSDLIVKTCAIDQEYRNKLKETIDDLRECFEK